MDVAVEIPIWSGPESIRSTLNAYIVLTKARVIELLLLVTVPTMYSLRTVFRAFGSCSRRSLAGR